jgi:hypothetical protein
MINNPEVFSLLEKEKIIKALAGRIIIALQREEFCTHSNLKKKIKKSSLKINFLKYKQKKIKTIKLHLQNANIIN